MVKLYKKVDELLFYSECWYNDTKAITHFGVVGSIGKTKQFPCNDYINFEEAFIKKYKKQGYAAIDIDHMFTICVELDYTALEIKDAVIGGLNEILGWRGLGQVDGYDVDATSKLFKQKKITIYCCVVDFTIAYAQIDKYIRKTVCSKCSIYLQDRGTVHSS
jgi:hypothetical protein